MSDNEAINLAKELLEHILRVHPNDAALVNRANALLKSLEDSDVDSTVDRGRAAARKRKSDSGDE